MKYLVQRLSLGILSAAIILVVMHGGLRVLIRHRLAVWPLQTLTQPRSSFVDEATRVVLYAPKLDQVKRPMVVVLGGSASQEGWLPDNIERLAPGFDSINFALGGPNMTEVEKVLDEVIRSTPADVIRRSTLVIGLTYLMFSPDSVRWQNPELVSVSEIERKEVATDIDRGMMRCPLVYSLKTLSGGGSPGLLERIALAHYRGYLELSQKLPAGVINLHLPLRQVWAFDPRGAHRSVAESQADAVPAELAGKWIGADKARQTFFNRFMGGKWGVIPDQQFETLAKIINIATNAGFRVVVVSMPLPAWHLEATSYFTPYHQKLQQTLAPLIKNQSVQYLDLMGTVRDDAFRDCCHPKESEAMNWSKVLVEHLGLNNRDVVKATKP
jgi:hypothetical protein